MKNIAFTLALAILGLPAMADTTNTTAPTCPCGDSCDSPCCSKTAKGIQCGNTQWLNIDTVTLAAANGDPLAQYTIAYLTDTGTDTPQDTEKAKDMYSKARPGLEKAAEAGDPRACKALAHMYTEGKGVDKDHAKAKEYMKMCKKCCCDKKGKDKKDEGGNADASKD